MSRTLRAPGGAWRAALLAALALAAAALAALTANPQRAEAAFTTGQCLGADITGRGASFARDAHLVFTQQFQGSFCQAAGTAPNITYDPAGSGAGRRAVGERGSTVAQNSDGALSRAAAGPRFGMTDEAPSTSSVAQMNMGTDATGDEDRIRVIPAAVGAAPPLVNFPDNCDVNLLPDASKTPEQNLDGDMVPDDVVRVRFTKVQLDAIFARDPGSERWTEVFPALAPDADCDKPIIRVVRFDDSGTTFVFKDYLDRANPSRNWVPGFTDPAPARTREWPAATFGPRTDCGGAAGPGSAGDTNGSVDQLTSACSGNAANQVTKLQAVDGSIGYADLSTARSAGLAITPEAAAPGDNDTYWTQVQNGAGGTNASGPLEGSNQFTEPTANDNAFRTVDGAGNPTPRGAKCQNTTFENVPADTFGDFVPTSGVNSPSGFGICSLTYGLLFDDYKRAYALNDDQPGEERKARTVKDYWTSIVSDGGQAVLFPQDYAPLPASILALARGGVNAVDFDKAATGGGGTMTPPVITPVTPPGGGGTPPPVVPSNRFSIVRFTTRSRTGTGQFRVRVPARGTLTLSANARPGGRRIKVDAVRLTFSRSGTYSLNIKPGRVAKRVLRRRGKLRINVKITFTPRGGRARSITRTVTLRLTRSVRR